MGWSVPTRLPRLYKMNISKGGSQGYYNIITFPGPCQETMEEDIIISKVVVKEICQQPQSFIQSKNI